MRSFPSAKGHRGSGDRHSRGAAARYEIGASQPTVDVVRRLAIALSASANLLLFGADTRGPDDELRLQFEAVSKFDPEEKRVVRSLLDGMILRHEARRWSGE